MHYIYKFNLVLIKTDYKIVDQSKIIIHYSANECTQVVDCVNCRFRNLLVYSVHGSIL